MSLAEIQREAAALPQDERVALVCSLLDTLPPPDFDVSDEEVMRRLKDLETGATEPMSHEEFVAAVQHKRGR
jgi:putative addiction module component (TIGR02574 family)